MSSQQVLVSPEYLESIAGAIRSVNGTENTYKPKQMSNAIVGLKKTMAQKNVTRNGSYSPANDGVDGYSGVNVNVPNSYNSGDEGKVVYGGALVDQTARQAAITFNGTYQTQNNNSVTVNVPQTGSSPTLVAKNISANGVYNASSDNADGYTGVTVNVQNTYGVGDEGKVVSNGALVAQTSKGITTNGTHNTTANNEVVVNVPNSYDVSDEGKVVDDGELVAQTSTSITANGTYDTTNNNTTMVSVQPTLQEKTATANGTVTPDGGYDGLSQVNVNVQNTFGPGDEGKVVSNGALVVQTARASQIVVNGTYDTTVNNSVQVAVPTGYLGFQSSVSVVASGV